MHEHRCSTVDLKPQHALGAVDGERASPHRCELRLDWLSLRVVHLHSTALCNQQEQAEQAREQYSNIARLDNNADGLCAAVG